MSILGRIVALILPARRAPRPACRLTEAAALDVAREALGRSDVLMVEDVTRTPAGVVWTIGTGTIGSGKAVRVADGTGEVIERSEWGGR